MNDSGLVRLRRLSTDEIVGTEGKTGLIERYFSLMPEGDTTLQDIELSAREMRIGDNRLCLHTLSDAEDLPGKVATDTRYEKLSTDRSDCRLSFASPVGLLLSCNHIYNQYVLIDNSEETLQKFEKSARNMQSLSRYSRSNSINREWIDQYLNEAHSYGLTSVRAHFNVMAWSDDAEELKHIKNDVGSQLASMEVRAAPQHHRLPDTLLGGDTRQCGGLPGGREFPHLHRTGGVPVHRGNQLPQLALALRHQDGGQAHGKTAAP
jgi:conjugation system TraG family ATPase